MIGAGPVALAIGVVGTFFPHIAVLKALGAVLAELQQSALICPAGAGCVVGDWAFPDRGDDVRLNAMRAPARELRRFMAAAAGRLRRDTASVVVHIGAHVGDPQFYEELLAGAGRPCHLVLVEPNGEKHSELRENVRAIGVEDSFLHIQGVAVCPNATGDAAFHKIALARLRRDVPGLTASQERFLAEWSSIERGSLLKTVRNTNVLTGLPGHILEGLESYVEVATVRCVTPPALLVAIGEALGLGPEAVGVFILDAESLDAELAGQFLASPGFAPAYVQLEWRGTRDYGALGRVVVDLASRGYDVYRDMHDVVAVAPPEQEN